MNISVIIQAGGDSRRMGQDKAVLPFLGRPLIERIIERVGGLGTEVLITTNRPEGLLYLGLPLIADIRPGLGALGGLLTALSAATQPLAAVVACDMPFASAELLKLLSTRLLSEQVDVAIPRGPAGFEPFHAVYRREPCLQAIDLALEQGERRMISWFPHVRVVTLEGADLEGQDPDGLTFINLNTPEEWQAAEDRARAGLPPDARDAHRH